MRRVYFGVTVVDPKIQNKDIMDVPVMNMSSVKKALATLLSYAQTTKREVRVAQFAKIRQYAERYKVDVNRLHNYL